MAVDEQEYVIVPWERDQCETDIRTIELPSREIVVQLEVPEHIMDTIEQLAERYEIPVDRALVERLEINRARVEVLAATSLDDTEEVRSHLTEAREYLAGVDTLDTTGVENDIEQTWQDQLEST
jgi:hypothetical protein